MENGNGAAEARAHALDDLMREGDLGNEQHDVAPPGERMFRSGEKDLRLPAARDAEEDEGGGGALAECRGECLHGVPLGRREEGTVGASFVMGHRGARLSHDRLREAGGDQPP